MDFDPAVSLRIVNNERLRRAVHWADYVDLRGALVVTSEAPMPDANCIESFAAQTHRLDALLDIGFALLRAYDRTPAVRLTPLDRPKGIERALRSRRLEVAERSVAMAFRGDATALAENREITIRIAGPDDVMTFRDIVAPASAPSWLRRMMRRSIIASMSVRSHTLYIGSIDGQ